MATIGAFHNATVVLVYEKLIDVDLDIKLIKCPICDVYSLKITKMSTIYPLDTLFFIDYECQNLHRFSLAINEEKIWVCKRKSGIDYHEYIKSPEWKIKADAAKKAANNRCQLCNRYGSLHAHHRTYERLGNELPEDITALCAGCHAKFHEKEPA